MSGSPAAATFHGGPIVVIGGGIVGCSIAFHLAVNGHADVTVLEAGRIGEGSTAKATGGIRQQFSSRHNAAIAHEAVDYFAHFADNVGEPFRFRQHGYLFLLDSAAQRAQAERDVAMQRDIGIDVELISPGDAAALTPGIDVTGLHGATYCPSDGSGSPADALAAFARQARRRGVRISENTPVTAVRRAADGAVTAVCAGGRDHPAEIVVNAAGPWARDVGRLVGLDIPVEPHPRQAFAIPPLPALRADMPLTVDLGSGAYVHPEAGGGAIIGGNDRGTPASDQATVRWELTEPLITSLVHRIPWMADAEIQSGWCGLREMTPDDHAVIGPCDVPGWWNAVGFSGHGFMQAPVVGRHLARWILGVGDHAALSPFRLSRFTDGHLLAEHTVF